MKLGQEDVGGTKLSTRKGDYHRALRLAIPLLRELGYCWMLDGCLYHLLLLLQQDLPSLSDAWLCSD
jgi:hypothetical protein